MSARVHVQVENDIKMGDQCLECLEVGTPCCWNPARPPRHPSDVSMTRGFGPWPGQQARRYRADHRFMISCEVLPMRVSGGREARSLRSQCCHSKLLKGHSNSQKMFSWRRYRQQSGIYKTS